MTAFSLPQPPPAGHRSAHLCDNKSLRKRAGQAGARGGESYGDLFQPTHLLIIAVVLLVLFGAKRIPELGKGLGEGLRGFRDGLKGVTEPPPAAPPAQQNTAPAPPPASNAPAEPKQS